MVGRMLMYKFKFVIYLTILSSFLFFTCEDLLAAHGVSIDGILKYKEGFTRFEYTSEKAFIGGNLTLHDLGGFDKLNPFTLKGIAPFGLEMFIFETLAVSSLDEPFAEYGLIAKDIDLAPDKLSVTFTIDENARFSDGSEITPEDVKFSLDILKSDKAHPSYQIYLQDISRAEILDSHRIRFHFARKNRELHMIAAQLPVMSKSFYDKHPFISSNGKDAMVPPVGSGPYIVTDINPGKSISYKRNLKYWANNHPTRKGMFNFENITVKYFKDQIVSVEAFKAGEYDFMVVNIAKQWQRDMKGRSFQNGKLIKKLFPHKNNAGMQGFVFNTRKSIFKDPTVRKALGYALDFEWINKTIFFNQYTRSNSYFSNSTLAAKGIPKGKELELLEQFRSQLPAEIFTTPLQAPSTTKPNSLRSNLRIADELLTRAGWNIKNGIRTNEKGDPFKFEILLAQPSFERVMAPFVKNLKKLGISADYRTVDVALYEDRVKRFDFDMVVTVFGQSQSPGNEQRNYWHSDSAKRDGSYNLAGVSDPIVDKLIDAVIYSKTQEELTAACKALDRVLWYGYYVVPNWYLNSHRIAYSNHFQYPEKLPLYYNPYQLLMTWWEK